MTPSTYALRSAPIAIAVLALALTGCSDDAEPPSKPTAQVTGVAECSALVPDTVLKDLGWAASGGPRVEDSTCTLETDGGTIVVQRRPVPATTEEEVPDAATEQFEKRCAQLGSIIDDVPGKEVDWLGDQRACVALPADGDAGTSAMVALVTDSVLMEFRVESDAPLSPDDAETVLTQLADAATAAA